MKALPVHVKLYIKSQVDIHDITDNIIVPIKHYILTLDVSDNTKVLYISLVKKHIASKYGATFEEFIFPTLTKNKHRQKIMDS